MTAPRAEKFAVESIHVGERLRQVSPSRVAALAASIAEIGLRTPISVRIMDDVQIDGEAIDNVPVVIAGAGRLAAFKKLKADNGGMQWDYIDCFLLSSDHLDAQLWEIDENLARAELTPAEIAEHTARRKSVWEEMQKAARQTLAVSLSDGRKAGPQHHKQFVGETAKATGRAASGIRQAVARGQKIAPDVLQAVKGTDRDKGTHLDKLAKMTPAEQREEIAKPTEPKRKRRTRTEIAADDRERTFETWLGVVSTVGCSVGKTIEIPKLTPERTKEAMEQITVTLSFLNSVLSKLRRGTT